MRINEWTLFLDRDGVINVLKVGDYVKNWAEFEFRADFLQYFPNFCAQFKRVIIVTNQQGVGKGLMSSSDLDNIHALMLAEIVSIGGRVDKIYTATNLAGQEPDWRKPNVYMGVQAAIDFRDIDFKKSLMIGDAETDILFGQNLGMQTILFKSWQQVVSGERSEE